MWKSQSVQTFFPETHQIFFPVQSPSRFVSKSAISMSLKKILEDAKANDEKTSIQILFLWLSMAISFNLFSFGAIQILYVQAFDSEKVVENLKFSPEITDRLKRRNLHPCIMRLNWRRNCLSQSECWSRRPGLQLYVAIVQLRTAGFLFKVECRRTSSCMVYLIRPIESSQKYHETGQCDPKLLARLVPQCM